ncbi:MAG: RluA family pseudouridine synthase [Holophagaceae bacterium]|nr:RluA family pseudouridine synthase [Holophagaceae bacterium]
MARLDKTWKAEVEDEALAAELHRVLEVSHRQAKGLLDASCVTVNGQAATKYGLRLKAGDTIAVRFDDSTIYKELPKAKRSAGGDFKVLFEDRHLLFVDKPAGLLTVPAEKGGDPNLADAITDSYRRRGFKRFDLFIVHRLDRFTSGVLVFGKTPEALHGLKAMFEEHKLTRVYKAILVGELPENSGTMTGHLVEHSKSLRMSVDKRGDTKGAKQAITHYRVLERLPGHTVVEVKLETGRRNQIRVQFADKGFPLLGDQVYGQESELIDRQALHAELLGFRHPVEEKNVTVTAPMPPDMEAALKVLRTASRVTRAEAGVKGEAGIFKPKITKARKEDRIHRAKVYRKGENTENFGAVPEFLGKEERPRRPRVAGARDSRPADRDARPAGPRKPADEGSGKEKDEASRYHQAKAPRPPRPAAPREGVEKKPRSTYAGARRAEGTGPAATRGPRPEREETPARSRYAGPRNDRPAGPRKERPTGGSKERPATPRGPRTAAPSTREASPKPRWTAEKREAAKRGKAPFKPASPKKKPRK